MDNCRSHDESLQTAHPDVEIMFLPPNTTSLIQPMDQSVIATFKSYYLRRTIKSMVQKVNLHRSCDNFIPENVVRNFWKSFSIMDAINFIEESWNEVKSTTITGSWKKILPTAPSFGNAGAADQPEYPAIVQEIVNLAREVEGEGFQDIRDTEILDLVLPETADYTPEEVEELSNYPDEDEENVTSTADDYFNAKVLVEILNLIENAVDQAMRHDPIMVRSLNFRKLCDEATKIYEDLYKDILRRARQSKVTDFFMKPL